AYTDRIWQPAISSASSIARWIDCTVDSMLATTPFFRPRDGWCPTPMISTLPSPRSSATMARIFEVPMSSPTIRLSSLFFIDSFPLTRAVAGACAARFGHAPGAVRTRGEAHGEAVRIAQVDGGGGCQLGGPLGRKRGAERGGQPRHALDQRLAADDHRHRRRLGSDAGREFHLPGTVRIQGQPDGGH